MGDIKISSSTNVHVFRGDSVTGVRYCTEILLPHVRMFRNTVVPQFFCMDNNSTPHCTVAVAEHLENEDIQRNDQSNKSPEVNPIERV